MIQVLFGFYDKNKNDGKAIVNHTYVTEGNEIVFNDDLMDNIFSLYPGLKSISSDWKININCKMATVIVDNYTNLITQFSQVQISV